MNNGSTIYFSNANKERYINLIGDDGLLTTNKEIKMIDKELFKAFDRIVNIAVDVIGDDCKDDLILVGTSLGVTEEELREKLPNLYERGNDNITADDFAEEEPQVEDEIIEEESTTEEE